MKVPSNPIGRVFGLLDAADRAVERFNTVLDGLELSSNRVEALLDRYEPALRDSARTVAYAGERFGPEQIDALIAYLEHHTLLEQLEDEVLPTMTALATVAPDLKELLAVSRGLNELMGSLPGLGRAKRRVDEELEELQRDADDPDTPRA